MLKMTLSRSLLTAVCLLAAGCAGNIKQASPPIGDVAAEFEAPALQPDATTYRLGPKDEVSIRTFREEDLSFEKIAVDSSGAIAFPFIGRIQAQGLTVFELADVIETELAKVYLKNPDVTVQIVTAVADQFVVEGAVNQSGVFDLRGDTSLIEAVARARGTSEYASRDDVVIFRYVNGQRMGALFDLAAIERGYLADPKILPGDKIIVHQDNARRDYLDLLRASPLAAAVFRVL